MLRGGAAGGLTMLAASPTVAALALAHVAQTRVLTKRRVLGTQTRRPRPLAACQGRINQLSSNSQPSEPTAKANAANEVLATFLRSKMKGSWLQSCFCRRKTSQRSRLRLRRYDNGASSPLGCFKQEASVRLL